MSAKIRTIVVGVEARSEPDPVLRPAIELAARLEATLHVVQGFMFTDPLLDAYAGAGYLRPETIASFGRDLQATLERQVEAITDRTSGRVHTVAGPPCPAIIEAANEVGAELIIVGATRHGSFPLSLLGSTSRAVLKRSPVPVLMMRPGVPPIPRKLLLPTDLSASSGSALQLVLALAEGAPEGGPEIRALLVIDESLLRLPLEQRLLRKVAEEQLSEFLQSAAPEAKPMQQVIRCGKPAVEILAEAKSWEADLMVLGTHGRKGLDRVLLGSVAEAAIRNAPCNVLVVPQTREPR